MKRFLWLLFLLTAALAALGEATILVFPNVVPFLEDLMPASLVTPPKGFDVRREGVERGRVESIEYDSKSTGCKRKVCIYTPPGFSSDITYPVFYLLHGSVADETTWVKDGRADIILDNLYAEKKLVPMIVVMPDGNPPPNFDYGFLESDLLDDLIPYVEKHYPVKADRQHRALAGISAGAQQALTIPLAHPDMFAYVGVFIGALKDREAFENNHHGTLESLGTTKKPSLLWLASGKKDIFYVDCQATLKLFNKYKIPYVYVEGKGLHDWETARNDLFGFAPLLFRSEK
jgi:enterochelin esterase-like enzyme